MIIRKVTENEKEKCYQFSKDIIEGGNQFNRFNQSLKTQINRTYIGKLAEYVFLNFLKENSVTYDEGGMFEIFSGQANVDNYDFVTKNFETVDIKTASLPFHSRIMIPMDQFHNKKDYYVGVKLHFKNVYEKVISPMNIEKCTLYGYIDRKKLEDRPVENFGEGGCKAYKLNKMLPIGDLLGKF
ncbi:hypothetical protein HN615_04605 [Candidatus Woesearchaeota archaeon]|jgi:hypothetical protein|nr:hypothetical protein [Candidatus Woesearchaeota archaeon]